VWDPDAAAYRPVPVVARDEVADGLAGPAIITQDDTTTLVRAGWVAERTGGDTLALERRA
jgi:N-methylhydantoinase A/oxoprolinase/acetone carboxylase beta subunit